MVTFLFWNLNKKPLASIVTNLARQHEVDVIILAECEIAPAVMLKALNRDETQFHFSSDSLCEKIAIYTRFSRQFLKPKFETNRITIRQLTLPARTEILLTGVHLPSKLHASNARLHDESTELAREIREVEQEIGHSRTVVVGDLNMNPFEDGLVTAAGFNAVMTRELASRQTRIVQSRQYPFFYNPMWGHFGDRTEGPSGTYYYHNSEHLWNIFDQVLLRPDVMPFFPDESLQILSTDGTTSFLSERGLPNTSAVSDHLPILFQLDL
ncbi:MAG: endonuclease/exonuclease/phosphatase family protein [Candidatus Poribacteria bacterium]|nr:endonuclease/exonuclease/phosphatase family protein [Candidatus Poribacteria bacterium]